MSQDAAPGGTPAEPSERPAPTMTMEEQRERIIERNNRNKFTVDNIKAALPEVDPKDIARLERIPCARDSLLSGLGMGTLVGSAAFFMMRRPIMASCNWAVLSFCGVSLASWEYCTRKKENDYQFIQKVMHASKEYEQLRREQARKEGDMTAEAAGVKRVPPLELEDVPASKK